MEKKIRRVKLINDDKYHMDFIAGRIAGIMQIGCHDDCHRFVHPVHTVCDDKGNCLSRTFTCKATDDEWAEIKKWLCDGILGQLAEIVEE